MTFSPDQHLRNLKGQQYLDVKWRLMWLREEHPDAAISTTMVTLDLDQDLAVFKAEVIIPGKGIASGHGSETKQDFPQGWVEKAETKAIGRALAALGFGTQFATELDEGERVADAPVTPHRPTTMPPGSAKNGGTGGGRAACRATRGVGRGSGEDGWGGAAYRGHDGPRGRPGRGGEAAQVGSRYDAGRTREDAFLVTQPRQEAGMTALRAWCAALRTTAQLVIGLTCMLVAGALAQQPAVPALARAALLGACLIAALITTWVGLTP